MPVFASAVKGGHPQGYIEKVSAAIIGYRRIVPFCTFRRIVLRSTGLQVNVSMNEIQDLPQKNGGADSSMTDASIWLVRMMGAGHHLRTVI